MKFRTLKAFSKNIDNISTTLDHLFYVIQLGKVLYIELRKELL